MVSQHMPIAVEGDNFQMLAEMLAGCIIDKATLVFDSKTFANV